MKYVTVKLTFEQANYIINVLEQDIWTADNPNDKVYSFGKRIITKLAKAKIS